MINVEGKGLVKIPGNSCLKFADVQWQTETRLQISGRYRAIYLGAGILKKQEFQLVLAKQRYLNVTIDGAVCERRSHLCQLIFPTGFKAQLPLCLIVIFTVLISPCHEGQAAVDSTLLISGPFSISPLH